MNIGIKTLGCKANRADTDQLISRIMKEFGAGVSISEVNNANDLGTSVLDVCVVNTCTVTHVADRKSRSSIRTFRREFPEAKIIVMGCGPKADHEAYQKVTGVDLVSSDVEEVLNFLNSLDLGKTDASEGTNAAKTGQRTRAVLKIQDGCNNFCSYCIIPFARGREKSFPVEGILDDVRQKEAEGFKEIVLTGINIGNWEGTDNGGEKLNLAQLIMKILDETSVARLRLSSIEPQNFVDEFEVLLTDEKYRDRFCPHLHMSLQSGADAVLEAMRRHYPAKLYKKVAQGLIKMRPEIALTTDVIVGFPGETEEDFEETYEFVRSIGFAKVHVFPYSKRRGTKAAIMDDQIPEDVKKARAKKLKELAEKLRLEFFDKNVDAVYPVLFEEKLRGRDGTWEGFTPNYIKVQVKSDDDLTNQILDVRLKALGKTENKNAAMVSGALIL